MKLIRRVTIDDRLKWEVVSVWQCAAEDDQTRERERPPSIYCTLRQARNEHPEAEVVVSVPAKSLPIRKLELSPDLLD